MGRKTRTTLFPEQALFFDTASFFFAAISQGVRIPGRPVGRAATFLLRPKVAVSAPVEVS